MVLHVRSRTDVISLPEQVQTCDGQINAHDPFTSHRLPERDEPNQGHDCCAAMTATQNQ